MKIGRRSLLALGGLGATLSALGTGAARAFQTSTETSSSGVGHFSKGGPTERGDYERLSIPYKERKKVVWPGGARIAAICYIAVEYWEENTVSQDPKVKRKRDWLELSEHSWYNFQN